jgi:hypothetical protein
VARALERLAHSLPVMPGEDADGHVQARLADALVTLVFMRIAQDPDPDRATVVIHARADGPVSGQGPGSTEGDLQTCEIEGGPASHPEVARRLACTGRIQVVGEDSSGRVVRLGRVSREPPAWMIRQLRCRDRECTFLGCGGRQFTQAHHVVWWEHGGRSDLDNLVLV